LTNVAKPLLKFENDKAVLDPSGLSAIREIPGHIYPVILLGDGRAGKSYLASRILNLEGGIDVVVVPVRDLLPRDQHGHAGDAEECPEDMHMLLMDCEGGNNAIAAIRTLVNVFGILIGAEVIFVAGGCFSEASLANLAMTLAARSLVQLGSETALPEQRLVFVVNKNTLRYDSDALETALHVDTTDSGRRENRELVLRAFDERRFCTIGTIGSPHFEQEIDAFKDMVLRDRRPFKVGGALVRSADLVVMLRFIVEQIQTMSEVSLPSMSRVVLMDGFLMPLVERLLSEMEEELPPLDDYDADFDSNDGRPGKLAEFDREASHLTERGLVVEARAYLERRLDGDWMRRLQLNRALGEQVRDIIEESREVVTSKRWQRIGGRSLLASVTLTVFSVTTEVRSTAIKRKGATVYTPWASHATPVEQIKEEAFRNHRMRVPTLMGSLLKQSPCMWRKLVTGCSTPWQSRTCVVKEGHMIWWNPDTVTNGTQEVAGAINFLWNQTATVEPDIADPDAFEIRPGGGCEWEACDAFTGGSRRTFSFSVAQSQHTRTQWMNVIQQNIDWAKEARESLGPGDTRAQEERMHSEVSRERPTKAVAEYGTNWHSHGRICREVSDDP